MGGANSISTNFDLKRDGFAWATAALAFCIPVMKSGITIPIVLLVVAWLMSPKDMAKVNWKFILLFAGIFIFELLGMINTSDVKEGWSDVESKMSLLIFPLIFGFARPLSEKQIKRTLLAFCVGTVLAVLIGFISSAIMYSEGEVGIRSFYTSRFSPVHHPSYIALYMNIAIGILGVWLFEEKERKRAQIYAITIAFLGLCLVFPASKMGFINFALILAFLLFYAFRKGNLRSFRSLFVVLLGFAFVGFLQINTVASNRVSKSVAVNTGTSEQPVKETESNQARQIVWRVAAEEALANPLGVGTGDVGNHLNEAYRARGFNDLAEKSLNPHNSFLQIAVALGIPAMLWLIVSMVVPFARILKNQNWIYGMFLASMMLNLLVESMLEKQSGVILFAFFNALLFFSMSQLPSDKMIQKS